jgi:hypothetical protein
VERPLFWVVLLQSASSLAQQQLCGEYLVVNVSATQGATSSMAGIGGVCDGNPHVHKVRVNALDGQFSRGTAFVSAFVLVCLDAECLQTAQGQDARTVSVVGAR